MHTYSSTQIRHYVDDKINIMTREYIIRYKIEFTSGYAEYTWAMGPFESDEITNKTMFHPIMFSYSDVLIRFLIKPQ